MRREDNQSLNYKSIQTYYYSIYIFPNFSLNPRCQLTETLGSVEQLKNTDLIDQSKSSFLVKQ